MNGKDLPIHLMLPMSGQGTRFQKAGYSDPKPLIQVGGQPMIERLLRAYPQHWPTTAVMAENHQQTRLPEVLEKARPGTSQHFIPQHKNGPGFALRQMLPSIPAEAPVLVSYCDFGMSWDSARFEEFVRSTECDACLVSYRGFHAHYLSETPYAYSRMQGEKVVEVREKGWFGADREQEYASCGAYYFRSAALLAKALEAQEQLGLMLNGESYTSLTVEALLQTKPDAHVRVFEIPYFFQWGTPEDVETFEYWHKALTAASKYQNRVGYNVDQVMIPMCGLGSRFSSMTPVPKPFIPIGDTPMFMEALQSLPLGKTHIVALEQHRGYLDDALSSRSAHLAGVEFLPGTPSGQALSVAAGLEDLKENEDLVVSACDHGIVLDPKIWQIFREETDADAAIFTIQGFPGSRRNPQAYAWVSLKKGAQSMFPEVSHVSVKMPISANPIADHLLVGSFWFRDRKVLESGLKALFDKDIRVNGEIYLDSIFNELIQDGKKIRIVPLEGYICWGDPSSLSESLYWQEVYFGRSYSVRAKIPGMEKNGKI